MLELLSHYLQLQRTAADAPPLVSRSGLEKTYPTGVDYLFGRR
jgi:hypothetical protein